VVDEEHAQPPKADDFEQERSEPRFDSAPPPGVDPEHEGSPSRDRVRSRRFERGAVPEMFKRAVEKAIEHGATRLADTPENVRNFVQDMKLPKEALHYLYQQVDETKNGLYRVAAKEIRDVLEQTHFADELTKVLTRLSFEIKTEIRFIPNDAAPKAASKEDEEPGEAGATTRLPKPEIVSHVAVKDKRDKDKEGRR
jgi:hypothetical protein